MVNLTRNQKKTHYKKKTLEYYHNARNGQMKTTNIHFYVKLPVVE